MRFSGRAGGVPWYLDRPSALYGLPARCLAYDLNGTALALHRGPLDLQVGEGLRLDSELVSARLLRLPEISGLGSAAPAAAQGSPLLGAGR
jgi:hypothetical protein